MPSRARRRLRNLGEYLSVRGVELALRLLPLRAALRVGRFLGSVSWLLDRRHRLVAEENAARALGLKKAEARRFIRRVYRNTGATSVETLLMPHILRRKSFAEFTRFEGEEHLRAALAKGKGLIVVTAHIGNWELAGIGLAEKIGSLLAVTRAMDNPLLDRYVRKLRERLGLSIVDRHGALRPVIGQLHKGGAVGMLIDQNQRKDGVFVDFFGRLAATVPSPASIALKYDVPVLAGYSYREGNGFFHRLRIEPPFELIRTGDHEADVTANTALFTRRIEGWVRRHPDQWFWLHSRWRTRPSEEMRARKAHRAAKVALFGRSAL